ncbi:unnamed protein product [Phytomonas sp. EM1]|nr:unnamed protein product [Phytomonas sp. EM1]|eukprot:CCW60478.1 unnamed protein product [Phytomonas sp. isolate EM1]
MDISDSTPKGNFVNGTPSCSYDEFYACSPGRVNGSLFRLVDNVRKRWYFYNDATDMLAKVRAVMMPGSEVRVLRDAHMSTRQTNEGQETIIEAEVKPCSTAYFIEGEPKGFELEFVFECAPVPEKDLQFKQKPRCRFDKAYKCFKENDNGLFFRLVDSPNKTWYFHNDTKESLMTATVEFDDGEAVSPLGETETLGVPEHNPRGVIFRLSVKPGVTAPFLKGDPASFRLRFTAEPAEAERPLLPGEFVYENGGPDEAVSGRGADVFRCFPTRGNGLLFRLVDRVRRSWAFYNDTPGTVMRVTLRLRPEESVVAGPEALLAADPSLPGATQLTLVIPPLETRKLLDGLPASFELDCVAEVAMPAAAAGTVAFRYGGPNPRLMRYDQVFSAWKAEDPEGGELFRLVDTKRKRWGFYSDTKRLVLKVRVRFRGGVRLSALGTTRVEVDQGGDGVWHAVDIAPLATVKFVQGEYLSYELQLMGSAKKSTRRKLLAKQ